MKIIQIIKEKYLAQPRYSIVYSDGNGEPYYTTLPPGIPTRDQIINAIISDKYPRDKMEAVINNYLLDMTDADAKTEFDAMQEFRSAAKSFAVEVMEELNNQYNTTSHEAIG